MTKKTSIGIIAAICKPNYVIGNRGNLPWHFKEDLRHFRKLTTPHPIIMGRKTADSLLKSLPNRLNLVLTKKGYDREGFSSYRSVEKVIEELNNPLSRLPNIDYSKAYVIGGAEIYDSFFDYTDFLEITWINDYYYGDTYFPRIIDLDSWTEEKRTDYDELSFVRYERK